MLYFATLSPDKKNGYDVTFVDLDGCVSHGTSLEDALLMANEALSLHIETMLEDGDILPEPSSMEEAIQKDTDLNKAENLIHIDGIIYREISVNGELEADDEDLLTLTSQISFARLACMAAFELCEVLTNKPIQLTFLPKFVATINKQVEFNTPSSASFTSRLSLVDPISTYALRNAVGDSANATNLDEFSRIIHERLTSPLNEVIKQYNNNNNFIVEKVEQLSEVCLQISKEYATFEAPEQELEYSLC